MRHKYILAVLLVSTVLPSCIVGTTVAIHNASKTDKEIQAFYPAGTQLPHYLRGPNDSLPGFDLTLTQNAITSRDYYRYPVKIPVRGLDTVARTYFFTLEAGHKVVLAEGYPSFVPQFGQVFIIGRTDTIVFDKKRTFFKKHPRRGKGGSWTYTITADRK